MVRCASKRGYQTNMCFKEIGLCIQNMIIILGLISQHIYLREGGIIYDHLMSMRIFTLIIE